ncbi:hypothetical protein [Pseudomonas koreensis]|uniref:hypothetical protein n=1 Tax=Pseudomonas koreensis TaxID=198620 RepID=UPI0032093A2E
MTGANSNSGGTTIYAGTLQLGNGGTTGSIVEPGLYREIDYAGTLIENRLLPGVQPPGSLLSVQTDIAGQINLVKAAGQAMAFWDCKGPRNSGTIEGGDGAWQSGGQRQLDGLRRQRQRRLSRGSTGDSRRSPGHLRGGRQFGRGDFLAGCNSPMMGI